MSEVSGDRLAHLRRVAEAADHGGREWEWSGGYPQTVIRTGDVILVANTFEDADSPARFAEFIATFDPPTVLALVEIAKAAREVEDTLRIHVRGVALVGARHKLYDALARLDSGAAE